jgi:hypothetical protein
MNNLLIEDCHMQDKLFPMELFIKNHRKDNLIWLMASFFLHARDNCYLKIKSEPFFNDLKFKSELLRIT